MAWCPHWSKRRSRGTCSTLPGLCLLPDSSDSELELSTVRHQPEGLDQLQAQTKFTKKELQSLYRGFKNVSAPHPLGRGPDPPSRPVPGSGRKDPDPGRAKNLQGTANIPGAFMGLGFCGRAVWGWAKSRNQYSEGTIFHSVCLQCWHRGGACGGTDLA